MTPERYQQIKRLYQEAAELPEQERAAFLAKACGDDVELRREVDKLVATIAGRSPEFLERPAVEQAAELLAGPRRDLTVSVPSMWELGDAGDGVGPDVRLKDLATEFPLPDLKPGSERYQIQQKLGEGGMGVVYLAYDLDLKRRVALKIVRTSTRESAHRFVEEAQVMAQLDHPNIVPLHDVGMTAGKPYYTMRLVRGESLREVVRRLREADESGARDLPRLRVACRCSSRCVRP